MTTITKERLNELAAGQSGFNLRIATPEESMELARIALASLEAEVAYFINRVKQSDAYGDDVELRTYFYELDALKSKDDFGGEIVPVYIAPPAPVSVPACFVRFHEVIKSRHHGRMPEEVQIAFDECASMLQGADGNSPVIPDGLRLALSNAGIAAPESDEMLAATCEKYIQELVTWVKDRKPFRSAAPQQEVK